MTCMARCGLVILTLLAPAALADDFVERVNRQFATIRPEKRSDLVLFPALAVMDAPPQAVVLPVNAMLLPAGAADWPAVEAWATAAPQVAAIEALDRATAETTGQERMALGQPYGPDGFPLELIADGLYTELGDPPTLAAADFKYIPALTNLVCLVHVEATRRAAAGDLAGAAGVLIDLASLGRQMIDRAFMREVEWGFRVTNVALHRIRDVAYTDFRSQDRKINPERLATFIDQLADRAGFLQFDRMNFPMGNRIAAEQMVARVLNERGGPNDRFAESMARVGAAGRPLRLFSEVAKWQSAAATHADWFDTGDALNRVYNDWLRRWKLPPFDATLAQPSAWTTLNPRREAVILAVLTQDAEFLLESRRMLRADAVGTRTALALLGYTYRNRDFPPTVYSVRPFWLKDIEADPYNPRREHGLEQPMEYFVPNRFNARPVGERQDPEPHIINIVVLDGVNFAVRIDSDQFILYSVGPDGAKGWADRVREDAREYFVGDYLIWPPVISLYRQHLVQTGTLR